MLILKRGITMPVKVGLKHIDIWNSSMEKEVLRYEEEPVTKDQIVFYGPSNFTRWSPKYGMTPLREAVLGKSGAPACVNRGFGSSCPEHHLYYYPRLVRPLEPRVLVYSPGFGNGAAFWYTLEESCELAQRVLAYAQTDFPGIRIYLCGAIMKRDLNETYLKNVEKWHTWLREYAEKTENCFFVDTCTNEPLQRKDIFVDDGVHYNSEGYGIYADFFRDVLAKELESY